MLSLIFHETHTKLFQEALVHIARGDGVLLSMEIPWFQLFLDLTLIAAHIRHCHLPPTLSWLVRVLHFGQ
jgi:hypothetical protein